jgi:hypothetical protein
MPYQLFLIANVFGAVCYVPLAVLAGYAVGYGLGHRLERLRESLGGLEGRRRRNGAPAGAARLPFSGRSARPHDPL